MAGITAAVIGVAGSVYAANKASKDAKKQRELSREAIDAADPYKEHRGAAADKLNALVNDPSSIENTAEYKARMQAAARQLAAQGYTGSGNAILEAANAGGAAYQQAFDNLAMLSGANQAPGGGYASALSANQAANDNRLTSIAGVTNNLVNLAGQFNTPASATQSANLGGGAGNMFLGGN